MVSVNELGRPEFALQWDEAVAIVAETADMLLARGLTSVPDPASVILTPDGTLHLLHDGPQGPAPAQRLGALLEAVLSASPCPSELRQVVANSMADPPAYATIEEFADALAFFERPGRDELIAAVAARASEVELEERAQTELERLEARTRKAPRKAEGTSEQPSPRHRGAVYVVAGVLLVVGIVAGALAAVRVNGSTPATLTERVKARVDSIAAKGLDLIGLRTPTPTATTPLPPVDAPRRAAAKPSKPEKREAPITISVKEFVGGHITSLHSTVTPEALKPSVRDENVYTNDAEGVEPAVLIRPHLPSQPPSNVTAEQIGVLDIVVSATGAVEQVRLISTSNRYQDRMIVAAAKAWQFEPATKDGQAVRYRTQIRITL
jgi:TonB family protein